MYRRPITSLLQKRLMSQEVKFTVNNTTRVITLNRPKKLNALNAEMCKVISPTLKEYAKSNVNSIVIINSSNAPRSLCSGGDVASVATTNLARDFTASTEFFTEEYSLNLLLATYNKPVVVLMDGITMGGGVGLATHVPFRVATENTRWCMPEMDIGFFPDVGVTFSLPRITTVGGTNAQLGVYLCLTGDLISGADAYIAGLASHYIPSANLPDLQARLGELAVQEDLDTMMAMTNTALEEFSTALPEDYSFRYSAEELDVIEKCFTMDSGIKGILSSLNEIIASSKHSDEAKSFAQLTKDKLSAKSPVSLQIAIEQFQRNVHNDIESSLKQDLITATNMCSEQELCEFSQATKHKLVDKQKTPYPWTKKSLTIEELSRLVSPKASHPVSLIKNSLATTWKKYPYHDKFMLPTEQALKNYITGNDGSGRSMAVTLGDVIKYFTQYNEPTRGKLGVEYLCKLIVRRKCRVGEVEALEWRD